MSDTPEEFNVYGGSLVVSHCRFCKAPTPAWSVSSIHPVCDSCFFEINKELTAKEQRIVALEARILNCHGIMSAILDCSDVGEKLDSEIIVELNAEPLSALAAHDAKIRREALEEAYSNCSKVTDYGDDYACGALACLRIIKALKEKTE